MSDNVTTSTKTHFVGASIQAVRGKTSTPLGSLGVTNSKQPYQLKTSIKQQQYSTSATLRTSVRGVCFYHRRYGQAARKCRPASNWQTSKLQVKKNASYESDLRGLFLVGEVPSETFTLESRKSLSQHVHNCSKTGACAFHCATNIPVPQSIHRNIYDAFPDPTVPSPHSDLAHHDTLIHPLHG